MINWVYQTGLDISLLIGLVLLLRNPVRHYLGANICYWLWVIPFARFIVWSKTEIPLVLLEKVYFPNGKILIKIFQNPDNFSINEYLSIENIWLIGVLTWLILRFIGWLKFRAHLKASSQLINIKEIMNDALLFHRSTNVDFYFTDIPSAPFVTGLLQPQICLPRKKFKGYSYIQQQCIIKHELAHLQRNDLWMQIIAEIIRAVFWFNPIVHIAWNAFRQDQELACDHQVLARSNKSERYEYGRVLLKGLHAHALPTTMAFFNNHKQRFIMLEKHNNSTINNILGGTLCTVLLVFALTKAPQSIAVNNVQDKEVSFHFERIPLKNIFELIFEANPKEIIGYENVPDMNVSLDVMHVSSAQVEKLLLKCSGLKLKPIGTHFEITKDVKFNKSPSKMNECIDTINSE